MKTLSSLVLALSLATSALAENAPAPKLEVPNPSPASTVKQRIGITDVEVTYSRPSVKGRKIFGGLVPYGTLWRTGANQATTISFSTAVKVNDKDVAAGSYELFTIPGESEWTIVIHKPMSQWGTYTYDEKNDVARVTTRPAKAGSPVESLRIGFDDLRDESATLQIAWDDTVVPVTLKTDVVKSLQPQIETVMSSNAEKKPYAQAALFYLNNNLDLAKAADWMDQAIKEQPGAFYFGHYKARILAKKGDKQGALAEARKSLEAAEKASGAIREEYVRLNKELIASLK